MSEKENLEVAATHLTRYAILLAISKIDSSTIEDSLSSEFSPNITKPITRDIATNSYVHVPFPMGGDFVTDFPELSGFIADSYPTWMTDLVGDVLNMTHLDLRKIARSPLFIDVTAGL